MQQASGSPLTAPLLIGALDHFNQTVGYDSSTPTFVTLNETDGNCSWCKPYTYTVYSSQGIYNFSNEILYSPSSSLSLDLSTNLF